MTLPLIHTKQHQILPYFVVIYVDGTTAFDYTWTKDGAHFRPSIQSFGNGVFATVTVPNGDYFSAVEGNYTCRVSLGGITRGSRTITVSLPGECLMHELK